MLLSAYDLTLNILKLFVKMKCSSGTFKLDLILDHCKNFMILYLEAVNLFNLSEVFLVSC